MEAMDVKEEMCFVMEDGSQNVPSEYLTYSHQDSGHVFSHHEYEQPGLPSQRSNAHTHSTAVYNRNVHNSVTSAQPYESDDSENGHSPPPMIVLKHEAETGNHHQKLAELLQGDSSDKKGTRTIGRPKGLTGENELAQWTDEGTELLIHLWQDHEVLYNVTHPGYHNKEENARAVQSIIERMFEGMGKLFTPQQIYSKFQSLKNYFCKERKRRASKALGAGTNELYTSRWKYYNLLHFLDDQIIPRNTQLSCRQPGSRNKKRKSNDPIDSSMTEGIHMGLQSVPTPSRNPSLNLNTMKNQDDDGIFGEVVARMMRKICEGKVKEHLKLEIQRMIVNIQYDKHDIEPASHES